MVVRQVTAPAPSFSDVNAEPVDDEVPDFRASAEASEAAGEYAPEDYSGDPVDKIEGLLGRSIRRGGSRETPKTTERQKREKKVKTDVPFPRTKDGFKPAIEQAYYGISTAVVFIDPEIAAVIAQIAPDAAEALNELAKTNPAFRRFLHNMLQTSAVGAVIVAHLPLILALVQKGTGGKNAQVFNITDVAP